jgi:outer membrane protein assembly factor BamB
MKSSDGSGKTFALKLLICTVLTGIAVFFAVQASLGARDSGVGTVNLPGGETDGSINEALERPLEGLIEELAGLRTFDLIPLWEQEVRGEAFITEDGGYLYITSTQGQVMAIDAPTGNTLWSLDLGVWVSAPPSAKEGVVYVGATNHVLYALDARSGALLWYYTSQGEILARPVVSDGMVFFTADNNSVYDLVHRLYALDARSGALLWIYDTESWTPSAPAVGTDAVYLGGYQREVYALQKTTGKEMWSFKASNIIFSSPRIISGKVLFTCIDGWVHALDAASGVQEWARKLPGFVWLAPPDGSGNLYACSHRDTLTAMALETGEELWTFTDGDFLSCSPIAQEEVVCAFNTQGGAYVVEASSGEPLGLLVSLYDFTSPPLLRGENFYAGSSDGFVRAYAIPADALP